MKLNTKTVPKELRPESYTFQSVPAFPPLPPLDVSRKLIFCFQHTFSVRPILYKTLFLEQ